MPLDTSIANVGEYYSSHYLTSTYSNDVKSLIVEWRRQGSNAVPRRIRQLVLTGVLNERKLGKTLWNPCGNCC